MTKNVFLLIILALLPGKARAVSAGDAALTVAISTASGAVLGASTLPFYSDPGAHTKSIFYGAAIGAVVGVFVAAYAGVEEGKMEGEDASLRSAKKIFAQQKSDLNPTSISRVRPILYQAKSQEGSDTVLAWYPVNLLRF